MYLQKSQIFILRPSWSGADYEPLVLMGCHQKARKSAQEPQVISGACPDLLDSEGARAGASPLSLQVWPNF